MHYSFPPDLQRLVEAPFWQADATRQRTKSCETHCGLSDEDEDLMAVREAVTEWRRRSRPAHRSRF